MLKQAAKRVLPRSVITHLTRLRRGRIRPIPPAAEGPKRLNIGCGTDYREGFVNIDGSDTLPHVDRKIDLNTDRLVDHFTPGSVDHILANDVVEHHFHWEAVDLLTQFFELLRRGGTVEIRVPDCQHIIGERGLSLEEKLVLLFGGQDVARGMDLKMDDSRRSYPQFFCHKYGWTMERMRTELRRIGFSSIQTQRAGTNFITYAARP
jgi:hypothetical protein